MPVQGPHQGEGHECGHGQPLFAGEGAGPQAIQAVKTGSLANEVWENGYKEGQTVFNTTLAGIAAGSSWKQKTLHVPGIIVTKSSVDAFLAAKHK